MTDPARPASQTQIELDRLRESETRYRTLFEAIDAGFCIVEILVNADGHAVDYRFLEVNPAFERNTGLMGAAGRRALELVPDLEPRWIETYGRVAATGENVRFVDDSIAMGRFFEVHAMPSGPPAARQVAILFNDITERRRNERLLAQRNESLERRVDEVLAGREVDQLRLNQTEEALRQSRKLETIGQLTGGVAHDFNNLLTPVVGALEIMRLKLKDDASADRFAAAGLQAAAKAKALVNRLLAFARRQAIEPQPVDVRHLIEDMRDLVERAIGPTIHMRFELAPVPPALVDANQLELAILNLAVNARDAMPAGGMLTISLDEQRLGVPPSAAAESRQSALAQGGTAGSGPLTVLPVGTFVRITVRDTGCGMDAETMRRAVEPFFTTKGVGAGTGLGLAMVHGLMVQLGGSIAIDSKVGVGTTVSLWLPESRDAVRAVGATGNVGREALEQTGSILLVDDEDVVRDVTAQILREAGYRVIEARSGAEALALVERGLPFDLLVTDQLMPLVSGAELATELAKLRPGHESLLLTAVASDAASELAHLAKPFAVQDLLRTVRELMDRVRDRTDHGPADLP